MKMEKKADSEDIKIRKKINQSIDDTSLPLFCHFCGNLFSSFHELERHIEVEHKENDKRPSTVAASVQKKPRKEKKLKGCTEGMLQETKDELGSTVDTCISVQTPVVHKCQFCEETFLDRKDFEKHVEDGHDTFEPYNVITSSPLKGQKRRKISSSRGCKRNDKDSLFYKCPFCSMVTKYGAALTRHMKRIHSASILSEDMYNVEQYILEPVDIIPEVYPKDVSLTRNESNSVSATKQESEHMDLLSSLPVVKLERMKLPVQLPSTTGIKTRAQMSEVKSVSENPPTVRKTRNSKSIGLKITKMPMDKNNKAEKTIAGTQKENLKGDKQKRDEVKTWVKVKSTDENQCPHCDFGSKRASALKFHIDFNHGSEKKTTNKRKSEKDFVQMPTKNKRPNATAAQSGVKSQTKTDRILNKNKRVTSDKMNGKTNVAKPDRNNVKLSTVNLMSNTAKVHITELKSDVEMNDIGIGNQHKMVMVIDKDGTVVTKIENEETLQEEQPKESLLKDSNKRDSKEDMKSKRRKNIESLNSKLKLSVCEKKVSDVEQESSYDEGDEDDDFEEDSFQEMDIDSKMFGEMPSIQIKSANENLQRKTEKVGNRQFKCPFCDKYSNQIKDIKEHVQRVHRNKDLEEDDEHKDNKKTISPKFRVKMDAASAEKFLCPFCPLKFPLKCSVKDHVRKYHDNTLPVVPPSQTENESCLKISEKLQEKDFSASATQLQVEVITSDTPTSTDDPDNMDNNAEILDDTEGTDKFVIHVIKGGDDNTEDAFVENETGDIKAVLETPGPDETTEDLEKSEDSMISDDDLAQLLKNTSEIGDDEKVKRTSHYCTDCNKGFSSYAAFWRHNMVNHNIRGKPYKCRTCSKEFVFQHQRNRHEEKHNEGRDKNYYRCDKDGCQKVYSEKKGLYRHLKTKHGENDPVARLTTKKEKKVYFCAECNILFKNPSSHWRHDLRFHKEKAKKHECKICSKMFLFAHELKDHMFVHIHRADIPCPVQGCHFKTKKLKYLGNHLRLQHNKKVDRKSLGEQVLSQEQMTPEELHELFPLSKLKEETGIPVNISETQFDESFEPDKQIEMLAAGAVSIGDYKETLEPDKAEAVSVTGNKPESEYDPGVESVLEDASGTPDFQDPGSASNLYKCKACLASFLTHRQLIKHKVSDHAEDLTIYKCDQCTKVFFTNYDLNDHKAYNHPGTKDHVCEVCGKSFPIWSVLQRHLARHQEKPVEVDDPKQGEAVCDVCGITLQFKASLQHHMRRAHPEKLVCSCKICSSQSDKLEVENNSTLPFCSQCNKYFCKKPFFESHMRAVHNTTGRHTCNFCPEKFSNLSQKNLHMHQMHRVTNESASCDGADVGQISTLNDDTHIIEISNEEQSGPKFLPKLSEEGLKAVTKELKIYSEDGGEKHWKCLLCGQCFLKVKYFNLHVRRTHVLPEHQPYRCKVCSAGFVRVGEFRKHTRSHSGFRPLKCRICHKSFKQQAHLKEHTLIHTDARKYKCEICQGRFKQRGALLAHVVQHDKLKPFKCQFCGNGYTVRGALSKHMKKYIGSADTDAHMCHICHKTFSHYPMLLRHIHIHQEPNPFICETCNQAFAAYTSLYFHKVKERHFVAADYEAEKKRKHNKRGTEVSNAVNSLKQDEGQREPESKAIEHVDSFTDKEVKSTTDSQETVEIIVKDPENDEGTTAFEVEGHTDEELLSIAKQLTEMSSYPGHEVYVDVDEQERVDEEEKIMMTMLDADDDVKSNLEKTLMLSKSEAIKELRDTKFKVDENTYVQILQYVDENGVPIEHVDENGIPFEHVIESHLPVEIDENSVQIQTNANTTGINQTHANGMPVKYLDENGTQIQTVYVDENGHQIEPVIAGSAKPEDVCDTVAENINECKDQFQSADESNFPVEQIVSENATDCQNVRNNSKKMRYHVLESGSSFEDHGKTEDLKDNRDSEQSARSHEQNDHTTDRNSGTSDHINEKARPLKDYEDHIVIAEGKIVERSMSQIENPGTEDELHSMDTSDDQTTADGSVLNDEGFQESDEFGAHKQPSVTQSEVQEVTDFNQNVEEPVNNNQIFVVEYSNGRQMTEGSEYSSTVVDGAADNDFATTSSKIEKADGKSVIFSSQLAKALTEDHFNISYTQSEHYITRSTASDTEKGVVEETEGENAVASLELDEPPVVQSSYEKQNIIEDTNQAQNDAGKNVDSNGLTAIEIPDTFTDSTAPMYVFKKEDGSLVYICVTQEPAPNITESSGATVGTEISTVEPDERDHSTLEAAENLQSLAGSSIVGLNFQGKETKEVDETNIQIHVYDNMDSAEIDSGHPLYDVIKKAQMSSLSSMRKVIKTDSSDTKIVYECSICHTHLKTKKNLRDHLKRHNSKEDRPFGCMQCPKRFVTKTELERHARIHSDDRPCECNVCGKRFRQPGHLLTHVRTHTGEKPFLCTICDARFTTSSLLKTHLLVHSDERNFECNVCQMTFKANKDLRRHRAVHSGIVGKKKAQASNNIEDTKNMAICHLCGKCFKNKYILKAHVAAEENLREFKCEVCGQGFNTKISLQYHCMVHENVKPVVCEVCGKSFKRSTNLKAHMKIHDLEQEGQSAFPCPACNKQFNHRGALYYHIGVSPDCMAKGAQSGNEKDAVDTIPVNEETNTKDVSNNNEEESIDVAAFYKEHANNEKPMSNEQKEHELKAE